MGSKMYDYEANEKEELYEDDDFEGFYEDEESNEKNIIEDIYGEIHDIFMLSGGFNYVVCGKSIESSFKESISFKEEETIELTKFYKSGRFNKEFDIYVDENLSNTMYVCGKEKADKLNVEVNSTNKLTENFNTVLSKDIKTIYN